MSQSMNPSQIVDLFKKVGPLIKWHYPSFLVLCALAASERAMEKRELANELHLSPVGAWQVLLRLTNLGLVQQEKAHREDTGHLFHIYTLHPQKRSLFQA